MNEIILKITITIRIPAPPTPPVPGAAMQPEAREGRADEHDKAA